jgi:hypothetical protein
MDALFGSLRHNLQAWTYVFLHFFWQARQQKKEQPRKLIFIQTHTTAPSRKSAEMEVVCASLQTQRKSY